MLLASDPDRERSKLDVLNAHQPLFPPALCHDPDFKANQYRKKLIAQQLMGPLFRNFYFLQQNWSIQDYRGQTRLEEIASQTVSFFTDRSRKKRGWKKTSVSSLCGRLRFAPHKLIIDLPTWLSTSIRRPVCLKKWKHKKRSHGFFRSISAKETAEIWGIFRGAHWSQQ